LTEYEPKRRAEVPRGRRIAKRVMVVVCALVLVIGATGVYFYKRFEGNITSLVVTKDLGKRPTKVGPQGALNVLVMGSDTRKGQGNHVAGSTPGLSDTTILLHLSKDRSRAYGVSIPRDAMVQRPSCRRKDGHGTDPGGLTQFNAAYAIGGPACTIKTVEHLTGVFIDHFVVIDFNGFKQMVDALGGIQVCVPTQVDDPVGNIHLAAGTYKVTGDQALDYVRVRHGISANGDIGRMKRQQTFIAAMIAKAVSAGTLTNPVKLVRFLDAATKSLTTDPEFAHLKELASLGSSLKNIGLDNVQFVTAPFELYPPDPNRVQLTPRADKLWNEIKKDHRLGSAFTSEVISASDKTPGAKGNGSSKGLGQPTAAGYAGAGTLKDNVAQTADQRQQLAANNGLCA
jgi:LCP family protein required for cell wall assembly